jgi:competence protein ComEC
VISVGVDNDYGHPAPSLLALLRDARMKVARTDRDGDVAVVSDHGLRVVRRGSTGRPP